MENLVRNLRIIWRAELLIIEAKLNIATRRLGTFAFAGLIVVFGFGMLNFAGFFALQEHWGPVQAAVGVAIADFVVAMLLVLWASRLTTGPELDLAREVRDAGLEDLEAKASEFHDEMEAVRDELLILKTSLASFSRNPLDNTINALLTPLLTLLVKSLSNRKK